MSTPIRPIRTEADHRAALARIEALMAAAPDSPEADELDVLATLVDRYESRQHAIDPPTPLDAIRFRMDQAGLAPRDLVACLGSRARVSEVLSGRRMLTLAMIRALNRHLGIPAESLIGQVPGPPPGKGCDAGWSRFPLNAMAALGWIPRPGRSRPRAAEAIRQFLARAGGEQALPAVLCRQNLAARTNAKADRHALQAWCYQLLAVARQSPPRAAYHPGTITPDVARQIAGLSRFADGPARARRRLARLGVHLVSLPHLPRTHLDGAVMMVDGRPVIGLTLRFDRIDNFWLSLCHELAHVAVHLERQPGDAFFDDLTLDATEGGRDDSEAEADRWAQDALIPEDAWNGSGLRSQPCLEAVVALAGRLRIHPAIVAGRVRRERRNYRLLSRLVGQGEVRRWLPPDCGHAA